MVYAVSIIGRGSAIIHKTTVHAFDRRDAYRQAHAYLSKLTVKV
jgi:hypothetical protein